MEIKYIIYHYERIRRQWGLMMKKASNIEEEYLAEQYTYKLERAINEGYELQILQYFKQGWKIYTKYLRGFTAFTLINLLMLFVVGFIPVVGVLARAVISLPLLAGYLIVSFKIINTQSVHFGDFFRGFQFFLPLLFFLLVLAVGTAIIRAILTPASPTAAAISSLIILACLYVTYGLAIPLIVDKRMRLWRAMTTSSKIISKHWFSFFGFWFLLFMINAIGGLFFLIGLLVTAPFSHCTFAAAYENIAGIGSLKDFWGRNYVGQWKDGVPNGNGTLTFPDGKKYVGEFKNGVFEGQGMITLTNGIQYIGEFKNGLANGQGTMTYPDGRKYVGEWKDNEYDGHGTLTLPDGKQLVGQFEKGKFIGT